MFRIDRGTSLRDLGWLGMAICLLLVLVVVVSLFVFISAWW